MLENLGEKLGKETLTSDDIKDLDIGKKYVGYTTSGAFTRGGRTGTDWTMKTTIGQVIAHGNALPPDTRWALDLEQDSLLVYVPKDRT